MFGRKYLVPLWYVIILNVYVSVPACVCEYLQGPEDGIGFPEPGIASGCEPLKIGVGN